jgi:hypothetical protein
MLSYVRFVLFLPLVTQKHPAVCTGGATTAPKIAFATPPPIPIVETHDHQYTKQSKVILAAIKDNKQLRMRPIPSSTFPSFSTETPLLDSLDSTLQPCCLDGATSTLVKTCPNQNRCGQHCGGSMFCQHNRDDCCDKKTDRQVLVQKVLESCGYATETALWTTSVFRAGCTYVHDWAIFPVQAWFFISLAGLVVCLAGLVFT